MKGVEEHDVLKCMEKYSLSDDFLNHSTLCMCLISKVRMTEAKFIEYKYLSDKEILSVLLNTYYLLIKEKVSTEVHPR